MVSLFKLSVNDLLVLDVDKRTKVGNRRSDQSQTPKRNELDQEIGNQRCKKGLRIIRPKMFGRNRICGTILVTYGDGGVHILGEQDALRLNDKEVGELLNVIGEALKRCLLDGEVLARSELGSESLADRELSSKFCSSRGTKGHPCSLEDVSEEVEVSSGKDEDDDGGKRQGSCAGVLPLSGAVSLRLDKDMESLTLRRR